MDKKKNDDIGRTLTLAFSEAKKECERYLREHPNDWFPCGFAWVVFPGRSPVVRVLKENKDRLGRLAGDKGYPKGWHIWDPSNSNTQVMEAKLAGAKAFVRVMNDAGYECYADCRMD